MSISPTLLALQTLTETNATLLVRIANLEGEIRHRQIDLERLQGRLQDNRRKIEEHVALLEKGE